MKEFVSDVEEADEEQIAEREAKIAALMEQGRTREEAENETDLGKPIEFSIDGREMKAYPLNEGQLAFMMASLGRGQSQSDRFASIINLMLATLRGDDKDYFETRLLDKDPKKRIKIKVVEGIFEYMVEEWFARPTQSASD